MNLACDIIGDIHGFAEPLQDLLAKLGYSKSNSGSWKHPEARQVVFVGDFVDRGHRSKKR